MSLAIGEANRPLEFGARRTNDAGPVQVAFGATKRANGRCRETPHELTHDDVRRCAAARPARSDSRSSSVEVTARRVRSDRARNEPTASEDRRLFLSVVLSLPPERTTPSAFVDRSRGRRQGLRPRRHGSRRRELGHAAAVSGVVRCVVARVIEIGREECSLPRSSIAGARRMVCADTFAQDARSPASDDARTFSLSTESIADVLRPCPAPAGGTADSDVFRPQRPAPCVPDRPPQRPEYAANRLLAARWGDSLE